MSRYFEIRKTRNDQQVTFWLVLIATWFLFFVTQHNFFFTMVADVTAGQLAERVTEGSLIRRTALPLLGLMGILCLIRYGRGRILINGFSGWTLLALMLWMFASVLWSDDLALTVRRLVAFTCLLIAAFGVATIVFERLPTFITAFCGLNLLVGVMAEVALGTFQPGNAGYRFGGTVHPNLQGVNLAFLILGCLWLLWKKGIKQRWLLIGGLIGSTIFLLLTQSRASMGALIIALLFTFCIQAFRSGGLRSMTALIGIAALFVYPLILFVILNPNNAPENLVRQIVARERDDGNPMALTGRVELWQALYSDYFAKQPIFGYGHDAFWSADRIEEISVIRSWAINQAHNAYLEWLLNLGIIGLLLYASVLLSTSFISARRFLRGIDAYGMATSMLMFVIFHNFLESINALPLFTAFFTFLLFFHTGFFRNLSINEK
jgi:exopolysaccharide production protein ExoQ